MKVTIKGPKEQSLRSKLEQTSVTLQLNGLQMVALHLLLGSVAGASPFRNVTSDMYWQLIDDLAPLGLSGMNNLFRTLFNSEKQESLYVEEVLNGRD